MLMIGVFTVTDAIMWLDNFNDENFDNKIQYQVRVYICTLQSTPLNNTT